MSKAHREIELIVEQEMAAFGVLRDEAARWSPHDPYGRQNLFLVNLREEFEVLYGGAAGGMKSDAILMAALEYVEVPHYAALILRRTYTDLSKPGALMDRAREWLSGTLAKSSDNGKTWRFPSGAVLSFGYMEAEKDKYQYQSSEFQFVAFDELTQFAKSQYTYLFSRLRRPAIPCARCRMPLRRISGDWMHGDEGCDDPLPDRISLERNARLYDIPLRMRAASNPGGEGHEWVKGRFIPEDYTGPDEAKIWEKQGKDDGGQEFHTYFVPSRLQDNPFIDQESYKEGLGRLDRVTSRQLLYGDWAISPTGEMFFDLRGVEMMKPVAPVVGELQERENDFGEPELVFVDRPNGKLAIWEKPQPGHAYVMGCDTASGRDANRGEGDETSRDWSVAQIRDLMSGRQVARLRGQISERYFGEYWERLSRWYNGAYLVPAVTGGYGRAALTRAIDCGLPLRLIYCAEDETGYPGRRQGSTSEVNLGFTESNTTRNPLYVGLDIALTEHSIETFDAVTINEYYSFVVNKDGKPEARPGCKDDCVTADALCVRGIKVAPRWLIELALNRSKGPQPMPTTWGHGEENQRDYQYRVSEARRLNSEREFKRLRASGKS